MRNENLLEVIIVDDGSSDAETIRILKEVAEAGYRVVSQPNRRVSAARNTGIRLANGEFILPLDSDNRIRGTVLERSGALSKGESKPGCDLRGRRVLWRKRLADGMSPIIRVLSRCEWRNFIDVCALVSRKGTRAEVEAL